MSKCAEFQTHLCRSRTKFAIAGVAWACCLFLSASAGVIFGPQITTSALPPGSENSFYNFELAAAGGESPYVWSLAPLSSPLPRGLTLSPSGLLSGTPTSAGLFRLLFRVMDRASQKAEATLSLTINAAAP